MQCRPTGIPDLQNLNPLHMLGREQAPLDEHGAVLRRGPTAPAEELCCQLLAAGTDRPYRWNLDGGTYVPAAPDEMSSVRELFARRTIPVPKSRRRRAGPGVCVSSPARGVTTGKVGGTIRWANQLLPELVEP